MNLHTSINLAVLHIIRVVSLSHYGEKGFFHKRRQIR